MSLFSAGIRKMRKSAPAAVSSGTQHKSLALSDLMKLYPDGPPQTPEMKQEFDLRSAEAAATRLFQRLRNLFFEICLKFGLDEADRIFAKQPKLILSNKQREAVNKSLINFKSDIDHDLKQHSVNLQASQILEWHNFVTANGGTPEYRELKALLAVIALNDAQADPPKRGKERYARLTQGAIRKQLSKNTKETPRRRGRRPKKSDGRRS